MNLIFQLISIFHEFLSLDFIQVNIFYCNASPLPISLRQIYHLQSKIYNLGEHLNEYIICSISCTLHIHVKHIKNI